MRKHDTCHYGTARVTAHARSLPWVTPLGSHHSCARLCMQSQVISAMQSVDSNLTDELQRIKFLEGIWCNVVIGVRVAGAGMATDRVIDTRNLDALMELGEFM